MNEREIKIDGLTKQQIAMLDEMWSLGSSEEFEIWYSSLSDEEVTMADYLKYILVYAVMDAMLDQDETNCIEAKEYLKKFMLKK